MHYEEQSRSAREMDWKADKLVFVFNSARPNLLLVQIGAALFNSARAVLNFHHLRVGNCESMYSRRKWWKETSVAPKEKGEQIDFKSDSGWKKWLKAFRAGGGGGGFMMKNFSALSYIRKHRLWVYGQWTFLLFHPPASFKTELSCTECLLSWFYRIALDSYTGTNRCYQRLWIKVRLWVLWGRNCIFVPYLHLTPKPLVFCL